MDAVCIRAVRRFGAIGMPPASPISAGALRAAAGKARGRPTLSAFARLERRCDVFGTALEGFTTRETGRVNGKKEVRDPTRTLHHVFVGDPEARLAVRERAAE